MANNKHAHEFEELLKGYKEMKLRIIQHAAALALQHFKQSFTDEGFTDQNLVKWKSRIGGPKNAGRGLLMNRGILKRGLRIKKTSLNGAIVGEDDGIPYAEIHNFGGDIKITPQMRRFFWAMYYQAIGGKEYTSKPDGTKGKERNNKRNQSLNDLAGFYKGMALTQEEYIKIPARQFIGDSAQLDRKIWNYVNEELNKFFKV